MDVRKHVIDSLKAIYELPVVEQTPTQRAATKTAAKKPVKKSKTTIIEGDSVNYKGIKYPILTGPKGGKFFMGPNTKGEIVRKSLPK